MVFDLILSHRLNAVVPGMVTCWDWCRLAARLFLFGCFVAEPTMRRVFYFYSIFLHIGKPRYSDRCGLSCGAWSQFLGLPEH